MRRHRRVVASALAAAFSLLVVPPAFGASGVFGGTTSAGEAIVLNHFWTGRGPMSALERALAPASNTVGFRPLSLADLIAVTPLAFVGEERVNLFGYWSLVRFRRD